MTSRTARNERTHRENVKRVIAVLALTLAVVAAIVAVAIYSLVGGTLHHRLSDAFRAAAGAAWTVLVIAGAISRLVHGLRGLRDLGDPNALPPAAVPANPIRLASVKLVAIAVGLGVLTFLIAFGERLNPGVAVLPIVVHGLMWGTGVGTTSLFVLFLFRSLVWRWTSKPVPSQMMGDKGRT